jgi:anti-sigma regulatory factor (Ser/Thr protein kinase)
MSKMLQLQPSLAELHHLGPWLREELAGHPIEDQVAGIELGVHELLTNIVEHGQPAASTTVDLQCRVDDVGAHFVITDHGSEVEPDDIPRPDPDKPQVRGYGLMIIEQLTDIFDVERHDDTNTWTLRFPIATGASV